MASRAGPPGARTLWITDLGLQPYPYVLSLQKTLAGERRLMHIPDVLLFTEHEAVFTVGRRGGTKNLLVSADFLEKRKIRCEATERGGDVTYHGPGQLVGYPVLRIPGGSRRVRHYVNTLEEVIIRTLERFGIRGTRTPGQPGIWAGGGKIAFIGLALQREVCFHGFALNVAPDLTPFSWMHPCGLKNTRVTSMKSLLNDPPKNQDVIREVTREFSELLDYEPQRVSPDVLPRIR
jgi:lipoate-protein ligase B